MAIYDCLKRQQDPIWTHCEVEKFWDVLRPYLAHLLTGEMPLPDYSIDFTSLSSNSERDKQFCMDVVHGSLWRGKYSLAVANLKALEAFFDCRNKSCDCNIADQLRLLEDVFKRRPLERRHVLPQYPMYLTNSISLSSCKMSVAQLRNQNIPVLHWQELFTSRHRL
ncbi:uncharacterized protein LOC113682076 [Pocillopora damicornis]|uniref:uncharacterized protein LOC113682076 n=1 Tax=Pocillopora damicornis TaxID=46731 RepID=UPI000F5545B8|nr:uncharacterized protein LOC113682076 [Pocillopora damicornis]